MKWKDIVVRASKTFIQGFLGSLAVMLPTADFADASIAKSVLIGGLAAGISAVMNMVVNYLKGE